MQLLAGHTLRVNDLAFSSDGRHLASCGNDRTVRVWDTLTGEHFVLFDDEGVCEALAFAPDGDRLIVRTRWGGLVVWSVADRHCVIRLISDAAAPYRGGLAVATATGLVAATEQDRRSQGSVVRLWGAATWAQRGEYEVRDLGAPGALAFNPQGTRVAMAGGVLDVRTGKYAARPWPVAGVLAWSPAGKLVAGSGSEGAAWVADAETGKPVASLTLGGRHAKDVGFSPDGNSLMAVSGEGVARSWDTRSWSEKAGFSWDIGPLRCVVFSVDGHRAACAGHRGVIIVWDWDG